jgi:hypothetical protein
MAAGPILLILCSFVPATALAKGYSSTPAHANAYPNAPQPAGMASESGETGPQSPGTGIISGTVLDTNGDVVPGATVTLSGSSGFQTRSVTSGSDGQFEFSGLPAGVYKLSVARPGMSRFASTEIPLKDGDVRVLPAITLSVSGGVTTVTVNGNKEELAQEQVQIALQQRVAGFIPNFYSSYDWNAPPMEAKQKFHLSLRSIFDPVSFFTVAGIAGAEQYEGIFPAYGSGIGGYGKRYAAAFANHASGNLLGRAIYPSIFRQDPRYFYKGKGSFQSRALYAIATAVMARGDDGRWEPNYSGVLGNFSAAAVSNLYYPSADRGGWLVVLNGLSNTGADAAANLIREFLIKDMTKHVPKGANGKP